MANGRGARTTWYDVPPPMRHPVGFGTRAGTRPAPTFPRSLLRHRTKRGRHPVPRPRLRGDMHAGTSRKCRGGPCGRPWCDLAGVVRSCAPWCRQGSWRARCSARRPICAFHRIRNAGRPKACPCVANRCVGQKHARRGGRDGRPGVWVGGCRAVRLALASWRLWPQGTQLKRSMVRLPLGRGKLPSLATVRIASRRLARSLTVWITNVFIFSGWLQKFFCGAVSGIPLL